MQRHVNNDRNRFVTCYLCKGQIQILQGNIQYSLDVHMQAVHSTSQMSGPNGNQHQRFQGQQNNRRRGRQNQNFSERGNGRRGKPPNNTPFSMPRENVLGFDNEMNFSQQQYARSEDQSSTSSGRSKNSHQRFDHAKESLKEKGTLSEPVHNVFKTMPKGQKFHRGFINEDANGEVNCKVCNVKIYPVSNIPEHLMKKTHGDNVIQSIKNCLPQDLLHTLEFLSFNYSGNLCCNLCSSPINLCSFNLHETVINIMAHNASQAHLSKTSTTDISHSDDASRTLKSLSFLDPLLNSSTEFIDCRMEPHFECKLCNKKIENNKNKEALLNNFLLHLRSAGHNKCFNASSVLNKFNTSSSRQDDKRHRFVVSKGNITCVVCNLVVEANVAKLYEHVASNDDISSKSASNMVGINKTGTKYPAATVPSYNIENAPPVPNRTTETYGASNNQSGELQALLSALPKQFKNINFIAQCDKSSVTCLICNCIIPAFPYNLVTHLKGSSHTKNEQALSSPNGCSLINEASRNTAFQTSLELLQNNPSGNSSVRYANSPNETSKDITLNLDSALDNIKKNDPFINAAAKCLSVSTDNYTCKVCNTPIQKSANENILKLKLLDHFLGEVHQKNYSDRQEVELSKLRCFDHVVKGNSQYLSKEGGNVVCNLCDTSMSISIDGIKLKKCLEAHLTGKLHTSKIQEKESAFSLSEASGLGSNNLVLETFKKLPAELQNEKCFIKTSSRIEGFLHCTKCASEIHPPNLQDHFLKEHIGKKAATTNLSNFTLQQSRNPAEEERNVRQNPNSLGSMFGNFDRKLASFLRK